jgi:hypothetical protein
MEAEVSENGNDCFAGVAVPTKNSGEHALPRTLSTEFVDDLRSSTGILHPILERARQDDTLMIAIRSNYINVYYRGGSILRLTEQSEHSYQASFDEGYFAAGQSISLPSAINTQDEARSWVESFQALKLAMDCHFSASAKSEREFQQLVARENNKSTISNESEYFIADIEFADTDIGAKFDMLAIRWLAKQRTNGSNCRATLIEMKYGDGALGGTSGLLKHLKDFDDFIASNRYPSLLRTMESQFNLLDQLDLLKFNRCSNQTEAKLNVNDKPEVVFILANHNPRSSKLKTIIESPEMTKYGFSDKYDLRFYVSSFAGYAMHADCMLPLDKFRTLLNCQR